MRKLIFTSLTLLIVISSCTDKSESVNPVITDFNWTRLEIPSGIGAYAVTGSIDDTLLVTTSTKAYFTTDQGKTWHESYDFHGPVMGLMNRNDSIFSLLALEEDQSGNRYASVAQYVSMDFGKTWTSYNNSNTLTMPVGEATSSTGVTYSLQANVTGSIVNPTTIHKSSGGSIIEMSFPYKLIVNNLYMDSQDRLYIAAKGATYVAETNSFYSSGDDAAAIIYVSKKALP